jgi:mRNA-degrading endonuclease RelE of RelBE toxin-antitoxin system
LRDDLEAFAKNPFAPVDIRRIKGEKKIWRIRHGNYRILFRKDKQKRELIALLADDRKDVY